MSNTLRIGGTVTVNPPTFTRMSAAAAAWLDAISPGLSGRMQMVNHLIPGITTITTDPTATGIGWIDFDGHGDPIATPDDVDATFGKTLRLRNPIGVLAPIDHIVLGNPTQVYLVGATTDITSNWHYTNYPVGGPFYNIESYNGDNLGGALSVTGTVVSSSRVDLDVDSSGWAAPPASGVAKLGFAGGTGNNSFQTVPSVRGTTAYGDIWYFYVCSKVNADYKVSNGNGGQKCAEIQWPSGMFENFMVYGGTPGDATGPIIIHSDRYGISYWDGVSDDPAVSGSGFAITMQNPATRATFATGEWIVFQPASRGTNAVSATFLNGTQVGTDHTERVADSPFSPLVEAAWRSHGINLSTTWGGMFPDAEIDNDYAEVYTACGVVRSGAQAHHFHMTCEEGDTPSHSSTFHIIAELRDANDVRLDCYTDEWNPGTGRQKLAITATGGATCTIVATTTSTYFSNDGLGRVRIAVDPTSVSAGTGPFTVDLALAEIANNDKLTGNHFDGSITVDLS